MRIPSCLAVVAVLGAGALAPARAAIPCPMLLDPRGDASASPVSGSPDPSGSVLVGPGEDLLALDIWSDRRTLSAVLRLDAIPSTSADETLGYWYLMTVQRGSTRIGFSVLERSGRWFYRGVYGDVDPGGTWRFTTAPGTTGALTPSRGEVRVSVPLRSFPASVGLRPGSRWGELSASVGRLVGPPLSDGDATLRLTDPDGASQFHDHGVSPRPMTVGSEECRHR